MRQSRKKVKDKCKHKRKQTKRPMVCIQITRERRESLSLSLNCIRIFSLPFVSVSMPLKWAGHSRSLVKLYIFISSLSLRKALDLPIYLPYWPNYFIFIKKCAPRLWNATFAVVVVVPPSKVVQIPRALRDANQK